MDKPRRARPLPQETGSLFMGGGEAPRSVPLFEGSNAMLDKGVTQTQGSGIAP